MPDNDPAAQFAALWLGLHRLRGGQADTNDNFTAWIEFYAPGDGDGQCEDLNLRWHTLAEGLALVGDRLERTPPSPPVVPLPVEWEPALIALWPLAAAALRRALPADPPPYPVLRLSLHGYGDIEYGDADLSWRHPAQGVTVLDAYLAGQPLSAEPAERRVLVTMPDGTRWTVHLAPLIRQHAIAADRAAGPQGSAAYHTAYDAALAAIVADITTWTAHLDWDAVAAHAYRVMDPPPPPPPYATWWPQAPKALITE